jgi:peptidyl-tRNA hydrolase
VSDKPTDLWVSPDGVRIKSWFILRRDLAMSKAKFGVQIGHGTDMIHFAGSKNPHYSAWVDEDGGNRRKIVLGGKTLGDIEKIERDCAEAGMVAIWIKDAGLTEFNGPTVTGLVVLPHPDDAIPKSLKRCQAWKD